MASENRRELFGQSALRGLAALTVFFVHAAFYELFPEYPFLKGAYQIFHWHGPAVDLFFALSGFILCYVYTARKFTWFDYGVARFARIYPVYITAILVFIAMNFIAFEKTGKASETFSPDSIITTVFLVQHWPFFPHFLDLNYPMWSISVEIFLYIFIFPVLLHLNKYINDPCRWLFVIVSVLVEAALYCLMTAGYLDVPRQNSYGCLGGVLFFTSGFFLCTLGLKNDFSTPVSKTSEILFLLLTASSLLFQFPINRNLIVIFLPVLVYLGAQKYSVLTGILSGALFRWLGAISYSIYVWHETLIKGLGVLLRMRHMGGMTPVGPHSFSYRFFYMCATIVVVLGVSHLSHFYFEMPVNGWIKKRLGTHRFSKKTDLNSSRTLARR